MDTITYLLEKLPALTQISGRHEQPRTKLGYSDRFWTDAGDAIALQAATAIDQGI